MGRKTCCRRAAALWRLARKTSVARDAANLRPLRQCKVKSSGLLLVIFNSEGTIRALRACPQRPRSELLTQKTQTHSLPGAVTGLLNWFEKWQLDRNSCCSLAAAGAGGGRQLRCSLQSPASALPSRTAFPFLLRVVHFWRPSPNALSEPGHVTRPPLILCADVAGGSPSCLCCGAGKSLVRGSSSVPLAPGSPRLLVPRMENLRLIFSRAFVRLSLTAPFAASEFRSVLTVRQGSRRPSREAGTLEHTGPPRVRAGSPLWLGGELSFLLPWFPHLSMKRVGFNQFVLKFLFSFSGFIQTKTSRKHILQSPVHSASRPLSPADPSPLGLRRAQLGDHQTGLSPRLLSALTGWDLGAGVFRRDPRRGEGSAVGQPGPSHLSARGQESPDDNFSC